MAGCISSQYHSGVQEAGGVVDPETLASSLAQLFLAEK
jgi:hypothetical protein